LTLYFFKDRLMIEKFKINLKRSPFTNNFSLIDYSALFFGPVVGYQIVLVAYYFSDIKCYSYSVVE
jgi:hypothetical protein